jgi:hypothetical protein
MPRLRDHGVRLGTKRPSGRPFQKGHKKLGGRKRGTPNKATRDVKEFFAEFMSSPEYQDNIRQRILAGRAVPIEQVGLYYTAGKPTEKVAVEDKSLAGILKLAHKMRNEKADRSRRGPDAEEDHT